MLFKIENGELTKRPNWFDMKATDEEGKRYKADVDKLLLALSKKPYGYGILTGGQLDGFSLIGIDVDIDTEECKKRLSKKIEELLDKHKIYYHKETTKSGRLHYYIALDEITDKMKSVPKLPYTGNCFKNKDGKEMQGEIELSIDKPLVVYDGFINDKEPFFTMPAVVGSHQIFENFLEDWEKVFKPKEPKKEQKEPEKKPKESTKEQKEPVKKQKETKKEQKGTVNNSELFSKIVEAYKIIRKYRIFNGWEIDKVFSSYCVRENIKTEQALEGFKVIFGSEYDEKTSLRILNNTKKKDLNLLPSLASVRYHIETALNSGIKFEPYEKAVLEALLNDLKSKGYELPDYLKDIEDIFLHESIRKGKYYKESYFIVRNVKGIKKVMHVSITTSEKNGIYKRHKLEKIKEIGIKAKIVRLVQDGKITTFEYLLNDELLYRPSHDVKSPEDIIKELTLKAVPYTMHFDNSLFRRYLSILIENYREEHGKVVPCIISNQTGWSDDFKFFYHYALNDEYHELHPDHLLYQYRKDRIEKKDEQHEIVKEILQEGKLLAVLLTASTSSILIKPLNIPAITVILGGNSGAGKTTSSLIATSLFYYSDDVLMNAQATKVGLEIAISKLNSLPILIDEGALAELKLSLSDVIFMVSSGKGKARGRKDLSVDFKELKSNVFWTTETTDIDELKRTGAFRRMLYFVIKSWSDLTELFKPEDRLNEKYAGCGVDYIKYAIEHMKDIKETFREETQGFSFKYREITTLAFNLHAGLILLEKYYDTKFINLRKTIDKVLNEAKALFTENKENVVQTFKDFLIANTTLRFHIVNANGVIGEKLSNRDIWGEYDANIQTYYILASSFKEIVKELGKERNLLVEELTKAGVLKGKNVSYWLKSIKQPAKVYILNFKADKEGENKTNNNVANNIVEDDDSVAF
jgi:hypothetical protein